MMDLFFILIVILIIYGVFRFLHKRTEEVSEYIRGYSLANERIGKGENAKTLLNQCRSSLTYDDFDRGWEKACKEELNNKKNEHKTKVTES